MYGDDLIYFDDLEKYLKFRRDKRMSQAHVYMMWRCVDWLKKSRGFKNCGGKTASVYAIKDLSIDRVYPDIYTDLFDIECETGLKHHYDDLKKRILNNPKTVIVVLPNKAVLERYKKKCSVRNTHLFFCTLETFPNAVARAIRPFRNRLNGKVKEIESKAN